MRSIALALSVWFLVGCSSPKHIPEEAEAQNLRKIINAYIAASNQLQRAPKNVEEFKPFLQPMGDPDEILRSPNDGEPYVIIWGTELPQVAMARQMMAANKDKKEKDKDKDKDTKYKPMPPPNPKAFSEPLIIAYEKRGSDGGRTVANSVGGVMWLSDEEFEKAAFPNGHKPQK